MDLDAEVGGDPGELQRQPRRVHEGVLVGLASRRRGRAGCRSRRAPAPRPGSAARRAATSTWCSSTATERVPVRSHSQSMPRSRTSASKPARLSWPRRASTSYSSGQRLRPLSSPWVSEASQKPPLRPDAAQPIGPRLEQHDAAAGVAALGVHRRPEPEVAAADDRQVGARRRGQLGVRRAGVGVVEPEDRLLDCRRAPAPRRGGRERGARRRCGGRHAVRPSRRGRRPGSRAPRAPRRRWW